MILKFKSVERTKYITQASVKIPFDLSKHTVEVDEKGVTKVIVEMDITEVAFISLVESMMNQMPSESGRAKWKCAVCVYNATNASHMREHVEIHIKGISHVCKERGKSFGTSKKLRVHLKVCGEQLMDATGLPNYNESSFWISKKSKIGFSSSSTTS